MTDEDVDGATASGEERDEEVMSLDSKTRMGEHGPAVQSPSYTWLSTGGRSIGTFI
jgi:hypothetical protein